MVWVWERYWERNKRKRVQNEVDDGYMKLAMEMTHASIGTWITNMLEVAISQGKEHVDV